MSSHRMRQTVVALVFVLICSVAWGSEPNDASIQLAFEVIPTAHGPFSPRDIVLRFGPQWRRFANAKPGYAAAIPIAGPTRFLPLFEGRAFHPPVELRADLSERQRAFLEVLDEAMGGGGWQSSLVRDRSDPNGSTRVWLYAVTLEDAQKMAQAYFQYAVSNFHSQIDGLEKLTHKTEGQIAEAEKRLSELGTLAEATGKSLDELRKSIPYRMLEEAQAAIGELDRMRNAAQVEIAGIRVRIDAIQEYQQQQRGGVPAVISKLGIMFIEESVALQGAAAREKMATHLREQANRFVDIEFTLANVGGERTALTDNLRGYRNNLEVIAGQMKSVHESRPQIPDRVVIYPVAWADDTPDR